MRVELFRLLAAVVFAGIAFGAQAQFTPYGTITLAQAQKAVAAAEAEARKNGWPLAIAVVDASGQLVAFARMDNTQFASVNIAQDKAWSAASFRRPTKAFQDGLAGGGAGLRLLALRGASPVEGGLPIIVDGKVIGGIGTSGAQGHEDAVAAKAGADALTK